MPASRLEQVRLRPYTRTGPAFQQRQRNKTHLPTNHSVPPQESHVTVTVSDHCRTPSGLNAGRPSWRRLVGRPAPCSSASRGAEVAEHDELTLPTPPSVSRRRRARRPAPRAAPTAKPASGRRMQCAALWSCLDHTDGGHRIRLSAMVRICDRTAFALDRSRVSGRARQSMCRPSPG